MFFILYLLLEIFIYSDKYFMISDSKATVRHLLELKVSAMSFHGASYFVHNQF